MTNYTIRRALIHDRYGKSKDSWRPGNMLQTLFAGRHMKEKSIEPVRLALPGDLKSGKELESMVSGLTWVEDVSLVEGMKELYPVYKLLGWIQPVKNLSNKLVILRK